MRSFGVRIGTVLLTVTAFSVSAEALKEGDEASVKLRGVVGRRFDEMLARQVMGTDIRYLTRCFVDKTEPVGGWRTEFWGKFMHAAAPFARCTDDPKLRQMIERSTDVVRASQLADGYIGSYPEGERSDRGWDVWGNKYTLLGLIHHYDLTGDKRSLEAAKRLCDYLIGRFGPGKRPIVTTGCWRGLASGSVLEPVVWLYKRTDEKRYLDFAKTIVEALDTDDGPRLIKEADIPPFKRIRETPYSLKSSHKSYEQMSCYQGLLEYSEVTGDRRCFEAAEKTARLIAEHEITLTGGAGSSERWFDGHLNQMKAYPNQQETCVTITWMRLCEKLLTLTGDPFWADQFEKSFYNAYLAALKSDGTEFSAYTPVNGTRSEGHYHNDMQTDCCNANGPRGFLSFLRTYLMTEGEDIVRMNWYAFSEAHTKLGNGAEIGFETCTLYPSSAAQYDVYGQVRMFNRTVEPRTFTLKLRIPAWSAMTRIEVNGEAVEGAAAGAYFAIRRLWKPGDLVHIWFDFTTTSHVVSDHVAFTRGPVVLARDTRFRDGDFTEPIGVWGVKNVFSNAVSAVESTVTVPGHWLEFEIRLPIGDHLERPERTFGRTVRFCDYATAATPWCQSNAAAVWLPLVIGAYW